jgi:predicted dithiol-disulfide oxidoreductase (DUF899 family)
MGQFHEMRYPGETDNYRNARDQLLEAERELRRQVEKVAAQRRALPLGGAVDTDYLFEDASVGGDGGAVRFSDLFEDRKRSLMVYSFMYGPNAKAPCALCNSLLDSLNGSAPHISQRINLVVIAKSPSAKIRSWAESRGWDHLRLLSSANTSYNAEYLGELGDDMQMPMANVFAKQPDGTICHTYGSELLYGPDDNDQGARHIDLLWPLWNVFDLTPDGRGADWSPKLSYD